MRFSFIRNQMKRKRIKKVVFELVGTSEKKSVENFINNDVQYNATKHKFDTNKNNKYER